MKRVKGFRDYPFGHGDISTRMSSDCALFVNRNFPGSSY